MRGTVFDIQRCSVGDGPGVRTSVFLKGCPLRCRWCHNPEGWLGRAQIKFDERKCTHCGACERVCENGARREGRFVMERCSACGRCVEACQGRALELCGQLMEDREVLEYVERDRIFYETSGGGMTLTGGEPLMQAEFALALLKGAKDRGIDACLETSGYGSWESLSAMKPYVSCFLYDVKETDGRYHKEFTGVSNEEILRNLYLLEGLGAEIVLRCPIIPGCNDRPDHFEALGRLSRSLTNVSAVHVEPYHPLGTRKRQQIGMPLQEEFALPAPEQVSSWVEAIRAVTDKPVRIA